MRKFVILFVLLPVFAVGAFAESESGTFRDTAGHPAEIAIEEWSGYGILLGNDDMFYPDYTLSRAEFANSMVRLVGYTTVSDAPVNDIPTGAWFHDDVMRLYSAGVMVGCDGYLRPYDPITLAEVSYSLERAFTFLSSDQILDLLDTSKEPDDNITRAEFLMILDNMFAGYYTDPGVYSGSLRGNALVKSPNVTFRDVWIDGSICIAEGVGNGFYTIADSAKIEGSLIIRAGRSNPYPDIDPNAPMIALTFDDGPSDYTPQILDTLEHYGVRGTFFVVGYLIERYSDTVKRAADLGNDIASHTLNHTSITSMSSGTLQWDFEQLSESLFQVAGVRPTLLRPPYGSYNSTAGATLKDIGIPAILWSIDPQDWANRNANTTYNRVMRNIKDGDIILLHDSVASTATATEMLVPELIARGYQLVTITELLTYSAIGLQPGIAYMSRDEYK